VIDLTAIDPYEALPEPVDVGPYWHKRKRFEAEARRIATAQRRRLRKARRRKVTL
jgi:hypothetical protein